MNLNLNKCNLVILGYKHQNIWAKIEDKTILERKNQKIFVVTTDRILSFDDDIIILCKKDGRKLSALGKLLIHCPLISMFCSRKVNSRLNHIHERALRMVYENYNLSLINLLKKENLSFIHHRNIQSFAIELLKQI